MTKQQIINLLKDGKAVYTGSIKFKPIDEPKVFNSDEEAINHYLKYKADVDKYYLEDGKLHTLSVFDYTYETFRLR